MRSHLKGISLQAQPLRRPYCAALHLHGPRSGHDISRTRRFRVHAAVGLQAVQFLPATTHWGVFGALSVAGAAGIWPIVSTLVGLLLSNTGVIPCESPVVYGLVNKYLLPMAIPLLLFTADLRRMLFDTGRLLLIFCAGSVATVVGTLVAFKLLPLASLGPDSWKLPGCAAASGRRHGHRPSELRFVSAIKWSITMGTTSYHILQVASALAARHIGGAVNYVGVSETLRMSASAQASGLAADNLLCAAYFAYIFSLGRAIPADSVGPEEGEGRKDGDVSLKRAGITVTEAAIALAVSCVVCYLGTQGAAALGIPDASIPIITLLSVLLATLAPSKLAPLVASAEGIAAILLSLFFAAVGANGNIVHVVKNAPALFLFCLVQIGVHLALILGAGKLMGFQRKDVLIASNANVGGPTTAAGMCAAKGWKSSLVPALLVGTFGYAIATFLGVALGVGVLKKMAV